jgi:hypothetical protein
MYDLHDILSVIILTYLVTVMAPSHQGRLAFEVRSNAAAPCTEYGRYIACQR